MIRSLVIVCIALALAPAPAATAADRPNVLLICIDDLRPELGCYGEAHMKTPHMDKLASQGRLFTRHYVHVPTCGASRYAMLSGRYPREPATWDNGAFSVLKPGDDIVTMPEAFRAAGYTTVAIGKISHAPDGRVFSYDGKGDGHAEMPDAWDESVGPTGKWGTSWNAFFAYADGSSRTDRRREKKPASAIEHADADDAGYPDGEIAQLAIDRLGALSKADKPFFLAVGFFKPHLPFTAPKRYAELYDEAAIALAPHREPPKLKLAFHGSGEFRGYTHPADANKDEAYAREVRRAYFAAVSYTDAQVGKVLAALDELKLAENTIVIVWGDHGYHLGDHAMWGKHTLFERSLRSAFIVRTPGMKQPGVATEALVGSVDIYPTLAELCGVEPPKDLNGLSIRPVLDDPAANVNRAVLGFWRMNGHEATSVRLDGYRVTEWAKGFNNIVATEVYKHKRDPNESRNLMIDPVGNNDYGWVIDDAFVTRAKMFSRERTLVNPRSKQDIVDDSEAPTPSR